VKRRAHKSRKVTSHKSRRTSPHKKQQGLSEGAVLLIFLVLISMIVIVFGAGSEVTKQDQIKLLNQFVIDAGEENGPAIIVGNSIDSDMLLTLANKDYGELKSLLGVTSDFVIYFEDDEGNLVEVLEKPCIGSASARVNGYRCDG